MFVLPVSVRSSIVSSSVYPHPSIHPFYVLRSSAPLLVQFTHHFFFIFRKQHRIQHMHINSYHIMACHGISRRTLTLDLTAMRYACLDRCAYLSIHLLFGHECPHPFPPRLLHPHHPPSHHHHHHPVHVLCWVQV